MQFSVTDAFISIFGIAVMDDVLLSFCIRALWEEGHPFVESTIVGRGSQFRAMMMTATVGWSSSADVLLTRVLQSDSNVPAAFGLAARRRRYDRWSKPRPWTANRRLRSSPNPRGPW
jgi:hypothetical protein